MSTAPKIVKPIGIKGAYTLTMEDGSTLTLTLDFDGKVEVKTDAKYSEPDWSGNSTLWREYEPPQLLSVLLAFTLSEPDDPTKPWITVSRTDPVTEAEASDD